MNRITSAIRLFFLFAILFAGIQANSQTINNWGVVGSATPNGWGGPDIPLSYNAGLNTWSAVVTLINGEIKFRNNNDWAVNYGDNGADGSLDANGSNIAVAAGTYLITLDFTTLNYSISQTKAYYVNDNFPAGDLFTSATGNNTNAGTKAAPFATITYALSQVAEGDTIYVDAGTYVEQVTIYKGVVIKGAGQNLTSILKPVVTNDPPAVPPSIFAERGVIQTAQSILGDVHISDLSVTGDYTVNVTPIIIQSGGSVRNCTLQSGNQGIFVRIDPTINLATKTFVVDGNTINAEYIAVNFAGTRLTATLTNNTIAAFNPGFSSGTWAGIDFGTLNGLTVTGNKFSSYVGDGVFINSNNCTISQNSFTGTGAKAINRSGGSTINATCNWYGSALAASVVSKITAGVTFSPWLINGTDNSTAVGFQTSTTCPVANSFYVNDNTTTGDVFTTAVGNNANLGTFNAPFATLDYAYSQVPAGATIYVDAGTYATPNLSIAKSITILGSNYNASPNNIADRLVINPVRNANALITGSTFTIVSNDVRLEGLTFNPGAKAQVNMASTGVNNFTFKRNYSIITSGSFLNLNGPLIPNGQVPSFGNYLVEDNRFESQCTVISTCIMVSAINDVTVNNNTFFTPVTSTQRMLTNSNVTGGGIGLTVNYSYTNNISLASRNEWFSVGNIASAKIENNISLHGQRSLVIQVANSTSSDIQVRNNHIETNFAELSPIQYGRSGTASPGAGANLIIENNTIIQNPTGRTSVPAGILAQNFFTSGNASTTIRRNKISFNGNYSLFPSSGVLGVSFTGNWQNINLDENEIEFNGTNLTSIIPASGLSSSGISISSDNGTSTIPANAVVNITGNKVNGFRNSLAVYDANSSAPNSYVGYGNLPVGVIMNINNNSFTGDMMSINNGTVGQSVNATCNWYGSNTEEDINSKLSLATVKHIPWLSNGTDNDAATGFQPVSNACNGYPRKLYVNDNVYTPGIEVFTTAVGSNTNPGTAAAPFATLDFAYSVAEPGDTIYVDAGYYQTSTDITLNKSITFLGTNYQISPKDPSNPLQLNPARLTETVVVNHKFIIAANDIRIKGFYLDPASKTQIQQTVTTNDFDNIEIEKNQFSTTTNTIVINVTGKQVSPLVTTNYTITDNWFVKDFGTAGNSISINAVDGVQINNNVFTTNNSFTNNARLQNGIVVGALGGNIMISNNHAYQQNFFINGQSAKKTTIAFNTADDCNRFVFAGSGNVNPNEIEITDNIITNPKSNGGPVLSYARSNGLNLSSPNIARIERNTITLNGTGLTAVAQSLIAPTLDAASANTQVYIRNNKLTITGDFSSLSSPSVYVSAIRYLNNSRYTLVENNEMEFTATNYNGANKFGIGVLHVALQPGTGFNFLNNKFSGFQTSIGIQNNGNGGAYGGLPAGVVLNINNNSFMGDVMSINNGITGQSANASCNWYGSAAAQNIINKLTLSTVDIIPWLTNGTDNDVATGFQPVPNSCDGYPTLITLNSSTNVTCNGGANGTINVTTSYGKAPFTYTWTKDEDAGFLSNDEDPTGLAPGTYRLAITDGNGSNIYIIDENADGPGVIVVTITEPDVLTATASGDNNVCFNGTIGTASVEATGGTAPYTYLWSNGATSSEISNLAAGVYSVTVTDANGCTTTASYEVTQPTQLIISITNSSTACSNIATVNVSGGTPGIPVDYTYQWSNLSTAATISGVPVGTYSVTVTDANGCTATASINLIVAEAFNPSASVTNVTCFGANDGIITVTNANGTGQLMFSKDGGVNFVNGSLPFSFTNLAPGNYNIAVKDVNGCTGFVTRTVTQPTQLTPTINSVVSSCFGQSTGAVTVSIAGGTPAYTYSWTRAGGGFSSSQLNISGVAAGSYTLTVTDKNGCIAVLPVSVPSSNEIVVNRNITNVLCRNTATGAINLTVTGGTGAGFTYSWTGAVISSNEDLNNIVAANNYNVRITDIGSGCFVDRSYQVTQPATLTLSITSSNNATTCASLGAITVTAGGGSGGFQYSINGGAYQNSNVFTGLYAGAYTITVRDANGCTATVSRSITDSGSDVYESNNGRTQSKPISIGTTINARLAIAGDAADWFLITTPSGGASWYYNLVVIHPVPGINYTVDIYPSAPNNAAALVPTSIVGVTKIYLLAPGTSYRIGVTTTTLSFLCYSLSINQLSPLPSRNNAASPAETESTSIPLVEVLASKVYPNPHRGSFTLRIESPEEGVATIEMYNVNGQLISERKVNMMKGKGNQVQYNNMNQAILLYRVKIGKHIVNGKIIGPN